jgi:hypothetical protein
MTLVACAGLPLAFGGASAAANDNAAAIAKSWLVQYDKTTERPFPLIYAGGQTQVWHDDNPQGALQAGEWVIRRAGFRPGGAPIAKATYQHAVVQDDIDLINQGLPIALSRTSRNRW